MGKGNAIKSAMSRERNAANADRPGGGGAAGMAERKGGAPKMACAICKQEVNATSKVQLQQHFDSKHSKMTFAQVSGPEWGARVRTRAGSVTGAALPSPSPLLRSRHPHPSGHAADAATISFLPRPPAHPCSAGRSGRTSKRGGFGRGGTAPLP